MVLCNTAIVLTNGSISVLLSRPFVIIQMIIRQGQSAQTLHGSIDLATQKGTHEIWVQVMENKALPNAMTCKVFVQISRKDFEPALLPLEHCLYKIKQATNQLGRFNAKHADNEVLLDFDCMQRLS
jgi:hypothetical protein